MSRYPSRQNEVLTLIARYGVMDIPTIRSLMKSAPTASTMRDVLSSLKKKRFIKDGTPKLRGRFSHYWMLNREEDVIERVQQRTGLSADQIRTKNSHWSQYPHETLCTAFQFAVESQFPEIKVLREATAKFENLPDYVLTSQIRENGYVPDMCLGIPLDELLNESGEQVYRWIAVEIDRTHRTSKRISSRANIYSRHTAFSGLLYLMPDDTTLKNLRKIYEERGARSSSRIAGSKDSFLAAGVIQEGSFDLEKLVVCCGQREIVLGDWFSLVRGSDTEQRDANLLRILDAKVEL